ncbi:MAG: polysaccharide biosynthesis/export family protein [Ferruginibacter sp.]|nr:polysaccharide biosynthesis/export family protein [Cytophagales bacterium]
MQKILYLLALLFGISSCVPNKKLTYLQDNSFSSGYAKTIPTQKILYRIQPNDVLSVRVQGATQEITNTLNTVNPANPNNSSDPGNMFLSGYSVDESGSINLPTVGKLSVKDLTVEEAQAAVQKQIGEYFTNTTVMVKLVSFKIVVLGAVSKPGYFYIFNGQATLLDALGLAGDMTVFGNRQNIKLVRQTAKGTEVVLLDLTKADVIKSPYFYLVPNDVVYVEALKAQSARNNIAPIGSLLGFITSAVLFLTFVGVLNIGK